MKKLLFTLGLFSAVTPAIAGDWTCAATCGYVENPKLLMALTPPTMVVGSGAVSEAAYQKALEACQALVPKDKKGMLVRAPTGYPELAQIALVNEFCVKN